MDTPEKILGGIIAIVLGMVSWWCKTIWEEAKQTSTRVDAVELKLAKEYRTRHEGDIIKNEIFSRLDRVANIELLLAQQYVTKIELKECFSEMYQKLDKIETKLDRKADK